MHHISFLRGTIDSEKDRYHVELLNSETDERFSTAGRISEILGAYDPETVVVEQVGEAVAEIHKRRGRASPSY